MQNILAKIGAFFEAHVEKFVLIVSGVVGLWLLMAFVVMSPNAVSYDNQTFSPGRIDAYVLANKAKLVQSELIQSSTASDLSYRSILTAPIDVNDPDQLLEGFRVSLPDGFLGLMACSIGKIDSAVVPSSSVSPTEVKSDGRQYALPYVGRVSQAQVGHIRAAAYLPSETVTDDNPYQSVDHDVNDVDLVTVQSRFDVDSLRRRFYESFAGGGVPAQWQDDVMAKPVFAAVHLQRQEQLPDGSWGQWSDVRHLATLPQSETYSAIENASDLPAGGIRVRMIRLDEETVRTNILQPPAYDMASTYEEWLPPEFHGRYQIERQKEEAAKRREERDTERNNRDTNSTRSRSRGNLNNQQGGGRSAGGVTGNETRRRGSRGGNTMGSDRNATPGGRTGAGGTARRGGRGNQRGGGGDDLYGYGAMPGGRGGDMLGQGSPLDEVFEAFEEIRLSPMKEFSRQDEIVFWSHDDSMAPGKTYRYRIRLGVLNPVAGLGFVAEKDIAFKDQVILWSDFSTQTEPVDIPERLYFFANTFQAAANALSVEVAKFDNGYWRSEIFSVRPGESIGRLVEIEPEEDETQNQYSYTGRQGAMGMPEPEPEIVDFSTDIVFVAAESVNKWIGGQSLRSQVSFDMLYSNNGLDIGRLPIGSQHWPDRLKTAYGVVKKLQKEPIEDYRSFGSSRTSSNAMGLGGQMGPGMGLYGR